MKKFFAILLSLVLACSLLTFAACGNEEGKNSGQEGQTPSQQEPNNQKPNENKPNDNKPNEDPKPDEENPNEDPNPDEENPNEDQKPDQTLPDTENQQQGGQQNADDDQCLGAELEQMLGLFYGNTVSAFTNGMAELANASKVVKTVEVTSGNLLLYSSEETYQKSGNVYDRVLNEKILNDLGAEEAYTERNETSTETDCGKIAQKLNFSLKDFRDMPTFSSSQDEMSGRFSKNIAKRIFGYDDDISMVEIHMKRLGNQVTFAEFVFEYDDYTVTVTINGIY